MCRLLETIRLEDGRFSLMHYHRQRFNEARKALFHANADIDLEEILQKALAQHPGNLSKGLFKCRVVYDKVIRKIGFLPYVLPEIKTLQTVECNDINYTFKYEDRTRLQQLYALRGNADDILIIKKGLVTDTSFCNILFYNGKQWLTPERPLLRGTRRASLLAKGQIVTAVIRPDDLHHFTNIRLVNAMIRFEDRLDIAMEKISPLPEPFNPDTDGRD